jgi:hypothetical protein
MHDALLRSQRESGESDRAQFIETAAESFPRLKLLPGDAQVD